MRQLVLAALIAGSGCTVDEVPGDNGDGATCSQIGTASDRCRAVLAEPHVLSLSAANGNEVVMVGLTTGTTCSIVGFTPPSPLDHVTSLAAIGTDVFYCTGTGQLTRVSLLDGAVTTAPVTCLSVTSHDGQLLVMRDVGSTVAVYPTFADALANRAGSLGIGECATVLGTGTGKVFSTWPQGSYVYSYDPATNASARVEIASTGIAVAGLAADGTALAVLDGGASLSTIRMFDLGGGQELQSVAAFTGGRLHGLASACASRAIL